MYYMQGQIQRRVREKEGGGGPDPPIIFQIYSKYIICILSQYCI
jgi:hypothetical protein